MWLLKLTLKKKVLGISIPILLLSFSLSVIVSYSFTQRTITDCLRFFLQSTQSEMNKSLELALNDINLRTLDILANPSVYRIVGSNDEDKTDKIKKILQGMTYDGDIIGEISIISHDRTVYSMSDSGILQPSEEFIDLIHNSDTISVRGGIMKDKMGIPHIPLGRRIINFATGQNLGYLVVYLRTDVLQKMYETPLLDKGYSFLVSVDSSIMSHPSIDSVNKYVYEFTNPYEQFSYYTTSHLGENTIFAISKLSASLVSSGVEGYIVSQIPHKKIVDLIPDINRYALIMEFFLLLVALVVSLLIASYIVKPLQGLKSSMKRLGEVQNGNFGDEIDELERAYNDMLYRIEDLIEKNNKEKEKQLELELIALQAQINPHFLYNTLDTIAWLAKLKSANVEKIVLALARFYRISLHNGDKFITVQDEINLIENFVSIEKERFPEKIEMVYNLDTVVLEQPLLKLTIQPIVENAIKHGIRWKSGKGRVTINGFTEKDNIVIEVIDDGVGFDLIDNAWPTKKGGQPGGYGLRNIERRIKLEYGEKYGIKIYSKKWEGTRVILLLRIR